LQPRHEKRTKGRQQSSLAKKNQPSKSDGETKIAPTTSGPKPRMNPYKRWTSQ
jgi:hypothetical protein